MWKAIREGDRKRANSLQKLILKSRSARLLAIRQVTQLNKGKKTPGVDGKTSLNFQERLELEVLLKEKANTWTHSKLREIPIPKKDGTKRILKVPTIKDRAWQCLVKYVIEPAHEALFHAKSYGFRVGRSAHDCQKILFTNLKANVNGKDKRVLELDIEKCVRRDS
ncbi:reverse transcriptase homolog [Tolypothrix sp. NIES-4075]|nr:reverse transcriptase homolog [Tolypothrix sp. NIES-4075]GAX44276.1 reverse transcriptase homolog [Tolypothrix sp. NIES-4075]